MKMSLPEAIRQASETKTSPAGHEYGSLSIARTGLLSRKYNVPPREVEKEALKQEIIPGRYERNLGTIGIAGQLTLLGARVGVAGLGGLGGLVVELLARMGVGSLVLIDGDRFSESNLNRQLLASEDTLGNQKAEEAAQRVARVNSAVETCTFPVRAGVREFRDFLQGAQAAVDCLDSIPSRFHLEKACQQLEIPLVHGAIGGHMGQVAVIWPGEPLFGLLYGSGEGADGNGAVTGMEVKMGNPAATPAMVASWQAGETVKVLLKREEALRGQLLYVDMMTGEVQKIILR